MNERKNGGNEINISFQIKRPPTYITMTMAIITVLILGLTDYLSGYEMSFSIFYLIPISYSIVFSGFRTGIIISLLSAVVWFWADILSNHIYSNLLIPIWNAVMRLGYFALHSFFLSQFLVLYQKTKDLSLTDSLTGINNWRAFQEFFNREFKKAERTKKPFTLLYLDLDNFKILNDTYGHSAGDRLLMIIARKTVELIRPTDIFARLGGDEFALLLPETDVGDAKVIIHRVWQALLQEIKSNDWLVTLSLGAISYRDFNLTIDEMMKSVDNLMYDVKKNGKNNIKHITYPH
jgi:diguanylate cyclase (GGDEF)-like protein